MSAPATNESAVSHLAVHSGSAVECVVVSERLGNPAAARYVGVAASTWRAYVARGQAPKPDGKDEGFGRDYWLTSTLDAWMAARPGPGSRTDLSD